MGWANAPRPAGMPKEGTILKDLHGHYWRVNRTRIVNLTPEAQRREDEYAWIGGAYMDRILGPFTVLREGRTEWVSDSRPPSDVRYW